jgi:phosphopentomutase
MVLDSLGIGGAPDAARFGDQGADTLGHIAARCAAGQADVVNLRQGPLALPNLTRLGLAAAARDSTGSLPAGLAERAPDGLWGHAVELSRGKDTPSGHWEIAGRPVEFDWGYFPRTAPAFPAALSDSLIRRGRLSGILGNEHASGTEIVARLGAEHMLTGKPICYTSADSVLQIAAHETGFGLARLYRLCEVAFELVAPWRIARVIARPFIGDSAVGFRRTANRRDFSVPPPGETLLDRLVASGREVIAIGKIADIFAHRGVTRAIRADGNEALFDATLGAVRGAPDGSLVFTNFVDFDTAFGHRRDVAGYAAALEAFDRRLPEIAAALTPGDLALVTADHGCDPTWQGTDHTRENVPVLAFGPELRPRAIGRRSTFADIGQSVAQHLGLEPLEHGTSWFV